MHEDRNDNNLYSGGDWDISLFMPSQSRKEMRQSTSQPLSSYSSREDYAASVSQRARSSRAARTRASRTQEAKGESGKRFTFGLLFYYIVTLFFMELVYRAWINGAGFFGGGLFFTLLSSVIGGGLCYALSTFFKKKANFVVTVILTMALALLFSVQLVYHDIFKTPFIFDLLNEANSGLMTFMGNVLLGILHKFIPLLLIWVVPLLVLFKWGKRKFVFLRTNIRFKGLVTALAVLVYLVGILTMAFGPKEDPTDAYNLYFKQGILDQGTAHSKTFGVLHTAGLDLGRTLLGFEGGGVSSDDLEGSFPGGENPDEPASGEVTYDTSPNVMDIDFDALIANESDNTVKGMHQYFQSVEPTNKNAYTGMFEGYNLIYLTAEAFSPFCVDPEITPTLYKMVHSGWEFTNYYSPLLGISTTDGEWGNCSGLFPTGYINGSLAFKYTGLTKTYLPFCLGNQFKKLNYAHVWAYHNHTSTYYNRHLSHPNMGYNYQGQGSGVNGGLPITKTWPESDLEMMQVTLPAALEKENFHLYYMTVSGHMNYTFAGNRMSTKHKATIQALRPNLSEEAQAYIACNIELDHAMEYTLQALEQAGKLDKTLIVLTTDHYPYGLKPETMSELLGHTVDQKFEMFKNNLIIYNPKLEHTVFDRPIYHLDVLPTISNLFGIEYDSRLLAGRDIFSTATPLVVFQNGSWLTDTVRYDASNGTAINLQTGEKADAEYVSYYKKLATNRKKYSKLIIQKDYYRKVFGE